MKITDAYWEQRNLGVDCTEVTIEQTDTVDEVRSTLASLDAEYTVVKLPSTHTDALFCMPGLGYVYVETSLHVTNDLKNINPVGMQKRLVDSVGYVLMTQDDINVLFEEIRKGLFRTDRIYVDHYFTPDKAANRYVGWISDEIGRGCDVYKLVYKDDPIGFFTMKEVEEGVYYPFLAGMYMDWQTSGLGVNVIYQPLFEVVKRGGKLVSTYISTNNLSVVRAHIVAGFNISDMSYVYVRHKG